MQTGWFSDNYKDMSQPQGADAGFEFEFYCERCRDAWRSGYERYARGRAEGWLQRAGGLAGEFGGRAGWDMSNMANAAGGLAQAGWHKARDEAFQRAIGQAEGHFHRCANCTHHVCAQCWNGDRGLCLDCAPDLQARVETARAQGEVQAASQRANDFGQQLGQNVEVETAHQAACPQCGSATQGAKFCPECGTPS